MKQNLATILLFLGANALKLESNIKIRDDDDSSDFNFLTGVSEKDLSNVFAEKPKPDTEKKPEAKKEE
jgi:predicted proteasome-type protease